MAIIKAIPGLEVYIEVAGERLDEYDIPEDSKDAKPRPTLKARTWDFHASDIMQRNISHGYAAKYIKVESGTYPCVQFLKTSGFQDEGHHVAYDVKLDDMDVLQIRHQPPGPIYENWEDSVDSVVVGTTQEQKALRFRFQEITQVEGEDLGFPKTSNVGTIRVRVYHMEKHKPRTSQEYDMGGIECESVMAKKVVDGRELSHYLTVEEGHRIESPEQEYCDNFLDKHKQPFAVFDFHYRSQDALINSGVRPITKIQKAAGEVLEEIGSRRKRLQSEVDTHRKKSQDAEKELLKLDEEIMQIERGSRKRSRIDKEKAEVYLKINRNKKVIDLTKSP